MRLDIGVVGPLFVEPGHVNVDGDRQQRDRNDDLETERARADRRLGAGDAPADPMPVVDRAVRPGF